MPKRSCETRLGGASLVATVRALAERRGLWILGVCLAVALPGCGAFIEESQAFKEGWRTAEIVEIGSANEIKLAGTTDCRKSASAAELATQRFVALRYRLGGRNHTHIVPIGGENFKPGDRVYTNVLVCGTPLELRSQAP
ncbi:hypothetical protein WKW79_15060 [Variovorax robiniae]|uniref:DUF4156 domain-containing protein n=1 Tax=Variovorax robiniae TaxID=1836199 RepID=A0ABU8X7T7_9BURK